MVAKKRTRKKAAKKEAKIPAKKIKKGTIGGGAFKIPMMPSSSLATIVGSKPLPRSEVTRRVWAYIKKNNLQDTKERRNINADPALRVVFNGKKTVNMFEMTKLISKQLSSTTGGGALFPAPKRKK